jgi:hypothetical protein
MGKILVKITPDGSGIKDHEVTVAVSTSESALVEYCEKELGEKVGKPEKFTWDPYYEVRDYPVKIVIGLPSDCDCDIKERCYGPYMSCTECGKLSKI